MLTTDDLTWLKRIATESGSARGSGAVRIGAGDLAELLRVYEAVLGLSDDMMDDALMSSAPAEDGEIIDGTHFAMLIDFMRMGTPEKLPLARRIMRAAFIEAFRLVPLATAKGGE